MFNVLSLLYAGKYDSQLNNFIQKYFEKKYLLEKEGTTNHKTAYNKNIFSLIKKIRKTNQTFLIFKTYQAAEFESEVDSSQTEETEDNAQEKPWNFFYPAR